MPIQKVLENMFSLLGRAKTKPVRDLEDLIWEVAEFQRADDFVELYRRLDGREVYVPVVTSSMPVGMKPGQTFVTDESMAVQCRTVRGPDGQQWLPCCSRQDATILEAGYAGMDWQHALVTALKMEPINGVVLQGQRSWIAFNRPQVQ